jgi:hypothetical protein
MRILIGIPAALGIACILNAATAGAADLIYQERRPPAVVHGGPVVAEPVAVWQPCPVDILCYVRRYPGWHDTYGGCRAVWVREARAGEIVVRRTWVC